MGIQTVAEQVYCAIKRDVLRLRFKPGEKITLKALQEEFGVSSTPIREALMRLQQDGLIEYQPNVGMRVVDYSKEDLEEIFCLMEELDAIALRFACKSPDRDKMIRELTELQAKAAQLITDQDFQKWEELSDQFHLILYQFANNSRLSVAAEKLRMQFTVFSYTYQQAEDNRVSIQQEHDLILQYLAAGDDAKAEAAMRRHIASSAKKALSLQKA